MTLLIYGIFKNGTNELIYKAEVESQCRKQTMAIRGKGGIGVATYTLVYMKRITNKDLLYNIGNFYKYSVMVYMEK